MAQALTAPFVTAALVLCVAGAAKLRSPAMAVSAAQAAGLPARTWAVRAFAVVELGLGAWAALQPAWTNAVALAFLYAVFSGLSLVLARRRASCGCFGESGAPASGIQSLLSAALAVVSGLAAAASAHGLTWILGQHAWLAAVLLIALAGSVYAAVVAYTALPAAWGAWSAR